MSTETALELILEKVEKIDEKTQKIDKVLTGNGHPAHGLIVKVDRLEMKARRQDRVVWTLFGIIMTGVAGLLFDMVAHFI